MTSDHGVNPSGVATLKWSFSGSFIVGDDKQKCFLRWKIRMQDMVRAKQDDTAGCVDRTAGRF